MAQGPMKSLLHCIRRTAGAARRTDQELLAAFLTRADEAAFRALLARHGPLVLGACRQVLRDEADVEDAFQATFLVLLKKGTTVRHHVALGGWLFRVARRVAKDARAAALARRRREARLALAPDAGTSSPDPSWREAYAALHEELDRLPDKFRLPLVLCYLQGQSRDEAARQLGWSVGAVKGRLERGRVMLRTRLVRRGFAFSAGLLAALENSPAAGSVLPPRLIDVTTRAAASPGVVPASVAALVEGGLRTMLFSKTKVIMTLLIIAILTGAAGLGGRLTGAAPPSQAAEKPAAAPKANAEEGVTVAGRVLDPDGKPTAGARLYLLGSREASRPPAVLATTDGEGRFRFRAPRRLSFLVAAVEGFGPAWVNAAEAPGDVTLRLAADDVPVAGRILDLQGKPLAGVAVKVNALKEPVAGRLAGWLEAIKVRKDGIPLENEFFSTLAAGGLGSLVPPVTTDKDGRFRLRGLGHERVVALIVAGPALETKEINVLTRAGGKPVTLPYFRRDTPFSAQLTYYPATFDHAAAPCRPVVGVVRDKATGAPVAGAVVRAEAVVGNPSYGVSTTTDKEGRYRLTGLGDRLPEASGDLIASPPEGRPYLAAKKPIGGGGAPEARTVDFALRKGVWVEGQVKDRDGHGVEALLGYFVFREGLAPEIQKTLFLPYLGGNGLRTDARGKFRFVGFPGRGLLGARADGAGQDRYRIGVGAGAIKGEKDMSGVVRFDTFPRQASDWDYDRLAELRPAEGAESVACDLVLDPGQAVTVRASGPDGTAPDSLFVHGRSPRLAWSRERLEGGDVTVFGLGADERRTLLLRDEKADLVGLLEVAGDTPGRAAVRLGPAAGVTGRLLDEDGRPLRHAELSVCFRLPTRKDWLFDHHPGRVRTDGAGRFRVDGLVPGVAYDVTVQESGRRYPSVVFAEMAPPGGRTKDLGDVKPRRGNDD